MAPMLSRRLGVAVAALDGFLYAVGGSDGSAPLNTVERYALTVVCVCACVRACVRVCVCVCACVRVCVNCT